MAGVDIHAHVLAIPVSAQKVRLLVDLVRGKNAVEALNILKFMPQRSCQADLESTGIGSCKCRGKLWGQPR